MIKMLQHKQYWFKVDTFGNRLHTNFTNLSSDLKPFVRYDGQNLVSIDIKNSQPYLSLKLLKAKYPEIQSDTTTLTDTHIHTPNPIMLVKSPETIGIIDVHRYANLVVNGTLYEYMETEIRKEFGNKYFNDEYIYDPDTKGMIRNNLTSRQRVKKIMFEIYFSKNTTKTKTKKLFSRLFPNVMRVFEDCKGNRRISIERRHKELAKKLQRLEAIIMLDKVAKEISKIKPELPIYTIHDSIVTTAGNENFVSQVMEKVITDSIGFTPALEPMNWYKEYTELKEAA